MEHLLRDAEMASASGLPFVALFTALTLPDICGALESDDGLAKGSRYKKWFDQWVAPKYAVGTDGISSLSGETCYAYRCGLLHQGRQQHEKLGYSRILFVLPRDGNVFHNNVINDALYIDVEHFVRDITDAVRGWLRTMEGNANFQRNSDLFMRVYPDGLPPYVVGAPVVS